MFIIKSVDFDNNKRKEIDSFFNTKGKLEQINHNTFIVDDYGLNKVTTKTIRPFLTTKNKNCVEYKFDNKLATFAQTKYCFIETTNVIINERSYLNVYKFLRTTGTMDGVQAIVYLDKDFILLKEEFLNGYCNRYKIEKVDKIEFIKKY